MQMNPSLFGEAGSSPVNDLVRWGRAGQANEVSGRIGHSLDRSILQTSYLEDGAAWHAPERGKASPAHSSRPRSHSLSPPRAPRQFSFLSDARVLNIEGSACDLGFDNGGARYEQMPDTNPAVVGSIPSPALSDLSFFSLSEEADPLARAIGAPLKNPRLTSKAAEMEREIVKQVREALAGTLSYVIDRSATFSLESRKEGWQRGEARTLSIQINVRVPGTDDVARDARREAKASAAAAAKKKKKAPATAAPPPLPPPAAFAHPYAIAPALLKPATAPRPAIAAAAGEAVKPAFVKRYETQVMAQIQPVNTCFFYRCLHPRVSPGDPLCVQHDQSLLRVTQPESDALFYLLLAIKTMAASYQERVAPSHRSCFCYAEGETSQALHFIRRPWMWAKTAQAVLVAGTTALVSEDLRTHLETEAAAINLQTQRNPDDRGKLEIFSSALPETRLYVRILPALPKGDGMTYPPKHCGAFQFFCAVPSVIATNGAGFDAVRWPLVDKDGRVSRHAQPASAAGIASYGPVRWNMHPVPAMRYLHPLLTVPAAPAAAPAPPPPPPPSQQQQQPQISPSLAADMERSASANSLGKELYML